MKKILILMFHPRLEASRVNKFLMNTLQAKDSIKLKDMYELYPDFNIDVKKEQEGILSADLIVMQHPFFWYAAPPLVKQWIDLVLEYGWAYGQGGNKLEGKKIMHVISSGGTFEAYNSAGKNRYTYLELLRPFELTYKLCKMQQLPPYIIPGANKIDKNELEAHCSRIIDILENIAFSQLEKPIFENVNYLNELN